MNNRICCIFNFAAHYRATIYRLMDKDLDCDFYLGDRLSGGIKAMDYGSLNGFKKKLKNLKIFRNFYWQCGAIWVTFKPYKKIILIGDPHCLSNWIILILARVLGKKTYLWTHGWYGRETILKSFIKKIFFGLSHHIFLYGNYAKELMIKEGFPPAKLTCIYNSLDYNNQLAIRKTIVSSQLFRQYFKNNNRNIIFIGRLTREKRLDLMLYAMQILKYQSFNVNFTIIGYGDLKDQLYELSVKLELSNNIWFYGDCYDEKKLSELIFNADLCVSPGNVGLTAMHSMVYGTPVITHDNFPDQMPEFEAIKDGLTGAFFKQGNNNSLAQSIKDWFMKVGSREEIRNNCYEVIDTKYNPHFQIETLKEILL